MNRPEIYHKSVQILYDAYFNDTLEHGSCTACAVGNLVAAHMNIPLKKDKDGTVFGKGFRGDWYNVVSRTGRAQCITKEYYGDAKKEIDLTGYSPFEIVRIEAAFEGVGGETKEDFMFNGLVGVLELLKEIHEITDEDLIQSNYDRFKSHYDKKLQTA